MNPSDIVLVKFPFSSLLSAKKRPALVLRQYRLSARLTLLTVAMISSRIEGPHIEGDYKLNDWQKEGLLHPSIVRLAKIATIDQELIEKPLGKLQPHDLKEIRKQFRLLYHFWLA